MNDNPNIHTTTSQTRRILAYLRDGNTITPIEALRRFGTFRLGARIADIEKIVGYAPLRKRVAVVNSEGKTVHVCQYWLKAEDTWLQSEA